MDSHLKSFEFKGHVPRVPEHFSSSSSVLQERIYKELFVEDEDKDRSVVHKEKILRMDFSNLLLMWTTKVKPFVCQMRSSHPFSKPFIGVSYIDISIFVILGRLLRTKFSKLVSTKHIVMFVIAIERNVTMKGKSYFKVMGWIHMKLLCMSAVNMLP